MEGEKKNNLSEVIAVIGFLGILIILGVAFDSAREWLLSLHWYISLPLLAGVGYSIYYYLEAKSRSDHRKKQDNDNYF